MLGFCLGANIGILGELGFVNLLIRDLLIQDLGFLVFCFWFQVSGFKFQVLSFKFQVS